MGKLSLLMKYRGKQIFDSGVFYAPYIPLQISNVMIVYTIEKTKWNGFKIVDNTKQPYTKLASRYGSVNINEDMYRKKIDFYIYGTLNFRELIKGLK